MRDVDAQIQRSPESGAAQRELSSLRGGELVSVVEDGARRVAHADRPPALAGVAIPSKDRTIRRRVVDRYRQCPWLSAQDVGAVTTREHLFQHARNVSEIMRRLGDLGAYLRADGEPKKIVDKYLGLVARLLAYDQALGLTPGSRLALGIDTARMRRLAHDDGEPVSEPEIAELEARLVGRLRGDDDDELVRDAARDARERP